ncbi:hypothetical protein HZC07_00695, partial [Candidatus Micrarchaeota archaeon]|nr:hypothetical protein [Candidatus Micrarchaeota archaeon]
MYVQRAFPTQHAPPPSALVLRVRSVAQVPFGRVLDAHECERLGLYPRPKEQILWVTPVTTHNCVVSLDPSITLYWHGTGATVTFTPLEHTAGIADAQRMTVIEKSSVYHRITAVDVLHHVHPSDLTGRNGSSGSIHATLTINSNLQGASGIVVALADMNRRPKTSFHLIYHSFGEVIDPNHGS